MPEPASAGVYNCRFAPHPPGGAPDPSRQPAAGTAGVRIRMKFRFTGAFTPRAFAVALASTLVAGLAVAQTQDTTPPQPPVAAAPAAALAAKSPESFSDNEIVNNGHKFFGSVSRGLAQGIDLAQDVADADIFKAAPVLGRHRRVLQLAQDALHTGLAWEKLDELVSFTAVFRVENEG